VLRRTYTGPRLFLTLLFLIAFFLPYAGKGLFWKGVNAAQESSLKVATELVERVRQAANVVMPSDVPSSIDAELVSRIYGSVLSRIDAELQSTLDSKAIENIAKCLKPECQPYPVWQVLIGAGRTGMFGVPYWTLSVILIVYSLGKFVLTFFLAPLRDEEGRSGYAPAWNDYRGMVWPDRVIRSLFYVAVLAFGWSAYHWLFATVWLPVN